MATPLPDKCVPGPAHPVHGADRISRIVYDPAGQPVESWDGVGTPLQRREAAYTYNGNGQKLSLTDARGYKAEMAYDGHGRQSRWVFPSKTTPGVADPSDYEQYGYDANGNRTSLRKRDGAVLNYAFDALDRVVHKQVPGNSWNVGYSYDLRGLQLSANFTNMGGGVTNAYDAFGRLASTTTHIGGSVRTIAHQYDRDGAEVETTFPDGQKFWTRRDGLGRMAGSYHGALGDLSVGLAVFYYDRTSSLYYFGRRWGTATIYERDGMGRPSLIQNAFENAAVDTISTFAYNPAGQIRSESRSNDAYAWTGGATVERPYSANGQNQYVGVGGHSFTYDSNGNLTSDGKSTFAYDWENRLLSASGDQNATLLYDPLGRLFQISSQETGTTQFLYDGDELMAEYAGSGAMLRRYVHGDGSDDPIYGFEGSGLGQPRFPHVNHQGSVVATVGPGGSVLAINRYNEYGIPGQAQRPATALGTHGRFQYTGQAWLPELGMYYYKARIYSPGLGRFLQVDPIGYDDQINLYAYVGNDPANQTDPTGTYGEKADAIADLMEWVTYESRVRGARTPAERERIARDYRTNFAAKGNHAGAYRANSELQRRTNSIQGLYRDGRTPTRSALQGWAKKQGFTETSKGENSPTQYVDENGVARLTIKSGSSRTPGSEGPHVEVRDADGRRVDPVTLRHVAKRTLGNHRPFDDDDAERRKGR